MNEFSNLSIFVMILIANVVIMLSVRACNTTRVTEASYKNKHNYPGYTLSK